MPAKQKSEIVTRKQEKARRDRLEAKARAACVDAVWAREGDGAAYCQDCGAMVMRYSPFPFEVGHVHEKRARSLGGDPHDPDQCELLCYDCHFNGPSGAHRRSVRAV
jgi:hypothetical protein